MSHPGLHHTLIFIKSDIEKLVKCYVYKFWGHPGCFGERKGPDSNKCNNMIFNSTHCIVLFFFHHENLVFLKEKICTPPPKSFNILTLELESTWMTSIEMLEKAKPLLVLDTKETILKCRRRRRLWRRRGRRSLGNMVSLGDSVGSLRPPCPPSARTRSKMRQGKNKWRQEVYDKERGGEDRGIDDWRIGVIMAIFLSKKIEINIKSSG